MLRRHSIVLTEIYYCINFGIKGHIYESVKNIYQNSYCSVNAGIKQGDSLSPTMFGIFINDVDEDVKSVNTGIEIDGHNICMLFIQIILYYLVTLKKDSKNI